MSDFIYSQQCDELIDGNYYNGEYQPTDQDLADMNQAWGTDMSSYVTDCDYCGEIGMCTNDPYGGTRCRACEIRQAESDGDNYTETEADVYQDSSYDDYPEMDW